jgi:hypothetical protein
MKKKKNNLMIDVTKGYEDFIKRQELKNNGDKLFNKVIKKAAQPKLKQRGSK